MKGIKIFLKNKKKKNDIKISQKMKNKTMIMDIIL